MPTKTFSQQVNDKQADEAVRQRAYKLLESLAEQIGSLQSGENRARMGSNIAESLWAHNEPGAREIFASVTKELKAGLEDDEKDTDRGRTVAVFLKLREDTAVRIGMHDPEWALSFLKETKPVDIKISDETENALYLRLLFPFLNICYQTPRRLFFFCHLGVTSAGISRLGCIRLLVSVHSGRTLLVLSENEPIGNAETR